VFGADCCGFAFGPEEASVEGAEPAVEGGELPVAGVVLAVDGAELPAEGVVLVVDGAELPVEGAELAVDASDGVESSPWKYESGNLLIPGALFAM